MKTIFLHGLGQTAQDWKKTVSLSSSMDTDMDAACPELFSLPEHDITYAQILHGLEKQYAGTTEQFRICGLSLGAILALDYTIRHGDQVASLVLIGGQYKIPSLLIDLQNILFCCMPNKMFEGMGLSKKETIRLAHSMRSLDFSKNLEELVCPVVIICGEKDAPNLKAAKGFKRALPQAELNIIPGAGHEVNQCAPEAIAAILDRLK